MTIDIEKLAKENGFITHVADDGECYADIETLKQFAEAYAAKVHDKRVEELEAKNRELSESLGSHIIAVSQQDKLIKELKATINNLRDALEVCKYDCHTGEVIGIAQQALSKTPAQSLIEHNNEVMEICAKVCEEVDETTTECPELAIYCAEAIRALKVSND